MKAALVTSFAEPPAYGDVADPVTQGDEEEVVVKASALSNLVRGQANGTHYSAPNAFPFVPGADGAGLLPGGRRVYFAFPRAPYGTLAERSLAKAGLHVPIPDDVDDVTAAAAANPGMSSWAALDERARFRPGESVLVNGATGASGRLAVQVARFRGAKRVVATGRNESHRAAMTALGADQYIALDQDRHALGHAFDEVVANGNLDVVLDYLWGAPAMAIIHAIARRARSIGDHPIRFVQIGSMAGSGADLHAHAFRGCALEISGSGLGSVSLPRLVKAAGAFLHAIAPGGMRIEATPVPLANVREAWEPAGKTRVVFTM
jgi:NADPH:quinone reductase-like Zn-dependent oxidoreductase